jgi:PTH1 family peptidyl-tRNA hydrolase
VKFGGGLAGHNGLKSIADKLGTRDWYRVRVGIGRPPGRMSVVDFVLTRPRKEAAEDFAQGCHRASQAVDSLIRSGLEKTQQDFN